VALLLNSSLSTKGFIIERGIINYNDALCLFYCKEIEIINHLFHHSIIYYIEFFWVDSYISSGV
jgi:hypothetical protein